MEMSGKEEEIMVDRVCCKLSRVLQQQPVFLNFQQANWLKLAFNYFSYVLHTSDNNNQTFAFKQQLVFSIKQQQQLKKNSSSSSSSSSRKQWKKRRKKRVNSVRGS
ncbi:hypothetical protein T01_7232 [Trichinella spiralis]|uniref:Uncharacterized protein n=1 Tax=Trichinella spiralis TaxID=6334 RepID=A0A0V1BYP3_TRISP|nr:hypothetical protein T01_7232 [Trichinella spiralis]